MTCEKCDSYKKKIGQLNDRIYRLNLEHQEKRINFKTKLQEVNNNLNTLKLKHQEDFNNLKLSYKKAIEAKKRLEDKFQEKINKVKEKYKGYWMHYGLGEKFISTERFSGVVEILEEDRCSMKYKYRGKTYVLSKKYITLIRDAEEGEDDFS